MRIFRRSTDTDAELSRPSRAGIDKPTALVGILITLVLVAVQIWDPVIVEAARVRLFDQLQRWQPRQPRQPPSPSPSPAIIVDIDDASLARVGQWPWPRWEFADLIETVAQDGALAITFDVLLAEPDRLSPPLFATILGDRYEQVATMLRTMPSNERIMADAMDDVPVVLAEAGTQTPQPRLRGVAADPTTVAWIGPERRDPLTAFADAITVLPVLAAEARGIGLTTVTPEVDGIIRRAPMIAIVGDRVIAGLAVETLRVALNEKTVAIKTNERGMTHLGVGGYSVPTAPDGRVWIHFADRRDALYVSAHDVLESQFEPGTFNNKIVLIGSSAAGLSDVQVTPVAGNMPGVEIQAQIAESLLVNDFLQRPLAVVGAERTVVGLGGLTLAVVGTLLPAGFIPPLLAIVVISAGAISWFGYTGYGLLIDGVYPAFALAVILFWLAMARYIREENRRRNLRMAFGRYLAPTMVDRIVASHSELALRGETRELTILFSDIRDFTSLSERHAQDPEGLTTLLNQYFTEMTDAILGQQGTVDKYIGDAIMAFWNAPIGEPDHPKKACRAALEMIARLKPLNDRLGEEVKDSDIPFEPIRIGIGLNTGTAFVGNMGSRQRFNYSVLGDPVNVAARLEGITKDHGFPIIVGDTVRNAAPDLAFVELDRVLLKGKSTESAIYALVGDEEMTRLPSWQLFTAKHQQWVDQQRDRCSAQPSPLVEECRELAAILGLNSEYSAYLGRSGRIPAETPSSALPAT